MNIHNKKDFRKLENAYYLEMLKRGEPLLVHEDIGILRLMWWMTFKHHRAVFFMARTVQGMNRRIAFMDAGTKSKEEILLILKALDWHEK